MKSGTDIYVPLRMNCESFSDTLTHRPAPLTDQNVFFPNTLVHDTNACKTVHIHMRLSCSFHAELRW